jgi:hypothetical protein
MRLRMKTSPNPAALPAKQQLAVHPRQLCIAFETQVLLGTTPEQRAAATQALVAVLMQASGVHEPEADDVQP